MKTKLFFLLFVLITCFYAHAQTIGDVLNNDSLNYFEKISIISDNNSEIFNRSVLAEQKRFYRWQAFWAKRVDTDGSHLAYPLLVMDYIKNQTVRTKSANTIFPEFIEYGPYDHQVFQPDDATSQINNIGRVMSVAVHPTNQNIVYAGSAYGGIFKTVNATTTNPVDVVWENVTDGFFCTGVLDIAIDPIVSSTIYAVTGNRTTGLISETRHGGEYGLGVWKSTDNGVSWFPIYPFLPEELVYINSIVCDPSNQDHVYVCSQNTVYKTENGGSSWTNLNVSSPNHNLRDSF